MTSRRSDARPGAVPEWLRQFPGIVLRLDDSGVVTGSNGQAESVTGMTIEGTDIAAVLDPGSSSSKWSMMLAHHRQGDHDATWELVLAGTDTLPEPRKFSLLPDADTGGCWLVEHPEDARIADVRTGVMDVNTELVETQRALVRERSRVAQAMRDLKRSNAALDEFAHVVSHDLKAPLRSIANYAKWTEEDLGDRLEGEAAHHLAKLQLQVARMQRLIDGVLRFARAGRQRSRPESVDVADVVREVIGMLAPPPEVRVLAGSDFPVFITERVPLHQVLFNLVGNAVSHGGPAVTVRIEAIVTAGAVAFTVADDGPGIPEQSRERIWRLFDAAGESGGSGIGLAVAKRLVEDRGGRIWLDATVSQGASFRFTWPMNSPARGQGEP